MKSISLALGLMIISSIFISGCGSDNALCLDTDRPSREFNGRNYLEQGTSSDKFGNSYTDACYDGDQQVDSCATGDTCKLREGYCDGPQSVTEDVPCDNGCSDGECLR